MQVSDSISESKSGCLIVAYNGTGQHWNLPMNKLVLRFLKDSSGATAIEYGLIAAGISVAIIAVVNGLGTQLNATFSKVSSSLAAQ